MAERYSEGKEVVEEAEKLTKLGPAFEKLKDFAEHGQQLSTFQRLYRGEHIAVNGLTPYPYQDQKLSSRLPLLSMTHIVWRVRITS